MSIENALAQGYKSNIEPYGNALMRAQEFKAMQQRNALAQMQGEDMHAQRALTLQQAQQAAEDRALQKQWRDQLQLPQGAVMPGMPARNAAQAESAVGGLGYGPSSAQSRMGAPDPRMLAFTQLAKTGGISPADFVKEAYPHNKIKDYKAIRNPDGSVSYVGLTEDGRAVNTGQQPFEKPHYQDMGGNVISIDPITNKPSMVGAKSMTPGDRATDARGWAGLRQSEAHFQAGQNAPQYMETDAGLVALPKKLAAGQVPTGTPVIGNDGKPLGKPLKSLPPAVNTAIINNAQSLHSLDKAIQLLSGKNVESAKGDAEATGWKGYLPQSILNRVDASGVDTRAEIADIGSLKIHDRSGAAVTISESPRLMPFIPNATDPPAVASRKLTRLKEEVVREQVAMAETYSKEQGYRPSPVIKPVGPKPTVSNW